MRRLRQSPPMMRTWLLFATADDNGHQIARTHAPGEDGANLGHAHFLDPRGEIVQPGKRQLVISDHRDLLQQLAIAVYAQRKPADQVLLCRLDLGRARPALEVLVQHRAHPRQRFLGLLFLCLQPI